MTASGVTMFHRAGRGSAGQLQNPVYPVTTGFQSLKGCLLRVWRCCFVEVAVMCRLAASQAFGLAVAGREGTEGDVQSLGFCFARAL